MVRALPRKMPPTFTYAQARTAGISKRALYRFRSEGIIEALGQALKAVGFAVPGALGVQEGGYIVVCQIFGLSPEVAIALSLMKRLRKWKHKLPTA